MIAARTASCPSLNSKSFRALCAFAVLAGIHEVQSPGDQECPCFQAGFLNVLVKCRLRPFGLAKLSPSCLQRERYFSRCGAKLEREGENVFRYPPPARGRCAAKRSLPPTLLARSSGQGDAILWRGRLLPGTSRPNLVDGVLEGNRNGDQKQ